MHAICLVLFVLYFTNARLLPSQAFAQVPDLHVLYGPDSYMGANIKELLQQMTMMTDEEINEIHHEHNRESIRSLLPRLHYYKVIYDLGFLILIKICVVIAVFAELQLLSHQDGTCIVHHLFGHEVVQKIREMYSDAFLTAHFEVPGEMFSLAMEGKKRGMGIVGSTQNILDFIKQRVQEAMDRDVQEHLQFVLGTESGMVTAIVAAVRNLLGSAKSPTSESKISVEIVFPVSSDSMTKTPSNPSPGVNPVKIGDLMLPLVPGVASGEGCSIHGGCASCPYMKVSFIYVSAVILLIIVWIFSTYKATRFSEM